MSEIHVPRDAQAHAQWLRNKELEENESRLLSRNSINRALEQSQLAETKLICDIDCGGATAAAALKSIEIGIYQYGPLKGQYMYLHDFRVAESIDDLITRIKLDPYSRDTLNLGAKLNRPTPETLLEYIAEIARCFCRKKNE